MRVVPIPCLSDNYAYLLVCRETGEAAIVDASEADPVANAIEQGAMSWPRTPVARTAPADARDAPVSASRRDQVRVAAILSTHHHRDHVGGNEELVERFGLDRVYGSAHDRGRVPGQTHFLEEGDTFEIGTLRVRALLVPGHTLGAVAYVVTRDGQDPVVFTGDTLFVGGAGRIFEGDPEMMHASLQRLAALEPRTRVYCGHEYTEANLRFAHRIEPSNPLVEQARAHAAHVVREGRPTVPSTIGDELGYNPFLRTASPEIRANVGLAMDAAPEAVLGAVRRTKDEQR